MVKVNQAQLKYARQRAETIYKTKHNAIRLKHTTPAQRLTEEEKLKAVSLGEFVIKESLPNNYYGRPAWYEYIVFPAETDAVVDNETILREQDALTNEYTKLLDELVLGDNEEALALLKAFES